MRRLWSSALHSRSIFNSILGVLILGMLPSFFSLTEKHVGDFEVYHRVAARLLREGGPIYSVAMDQSRVFKYPPYALLPFLPLGALDYTVAKWIWFGIQLACFFYLHLFLARRVRRLTVLLGVSLLFWGLWQLQFFDQQISLVMVSVWCWAAQRLDQKKGRVLWPMTAWAGTAALKVFSLTALFGLWPRVLKEKKWLWALPGTVGILGLLSLAILSLDQTVAGPVGAWTAYQEAITSTATLTDEGGVRGVYNQGLPAFFLRLFSVPSTWLAADLMVTLLLLVICMLLYLKWTRTATQADWFTVASGWMALSAVIHPLPFRYSLICALPLAVQVCDRAPNQTWAWVGTLLLTLSSPKVFGEFLGGSLEWCSARSWGILILCWQLGVFLRRSRDLDT